MDLLHGKAIIVTGAGRGLGRAYAMALAGEGARVVVNDVDGHEAERTVRDIRAAGGGAESNVESVADWDGARRLVEQCAGSFGGVDVLVNNAGLHHAALFEEETQEGINALLDVNLKGVLFATRHALDHMIGRPGGAIINVTSGAQSGVRAHTIYGASKAAVAGFTYSLAIDMAPHGIRVNAISPVAFTRMHAPPEKGAIPKNSFLPENVAPLVVFLASDEARHIHGQVIRLEGDSLGLVAHPRAVYTLNHPGGWSVEEIGKAFKDILGPRLEPVGLGARAYIYGPDVEQGPRTSRDA